MKDMILADAPHHTVLKITKGLPMDQGFAKGDLLFRGRTNTTGSNGRNVWGMFALSTGVWYSDRQLRQQYKDHDRLAKVQVVVTKLLKGA